MREIFHGNQKEKVLVFTQFRETQALAAMLCEAEGWGVNIFHGQLDPKQKNEAVAQFQRRKGPQVLVSTEAGGEGRNLQFCHWLVNYDLPWNPMRVEQRIGRLDRIGQTNTVMIGNLYVKESIEQRVLDVLETRIQAFEETVGGLDEILGGAETDIRRIMALADDKRDKATEDFAQQYEDRRQAAIQAGGILGDFIMDTKSYQREIVEQITGKTSSINPERFEEFLKRLVVDVGTYIRGAGDGTYSLTFQGQFHDRFRRELFPQSGEVMAVLGRDGPREDSQATMLAFGNKIVDYIVELVAADDYLGNTGTRVIRSDIDLAPTEGWLFHYRFVVPGPRQVEHLLAVFVDDSGDASLEVGKALIARTTRFDKEGSLDSSQIPENLEQAQILADDYAQQHRNGIQVDIQARAQERYEVETARTEAVYKYRNQVHSRKISNLELRIEGSESLTEEQRRILPVWQKDCGMHRMPKTPIVESDKRDLTNSTSIVIHRLTGHSPQSGALL